MAIAENELTMPALQVMATKPNGFITTTDLIAALEDLLEPTGEDAEILKDRPDSKFSQKVRNLVSHRMNSTGLEAMGFAIYDEALSGWQITDAGRQTAAG